MANHSNICVHRSETALFCWRNCFLLFEGFAGCSSHQLKQLRRQCRNVVELFDMLARQQKSRTGCNRYLEKTPQHVFHLGFILRHFPTAKVVHVVRDPRDGFVSSKSNPGIVQKDPEIYARYWRRCLEARMRFFGHERINDVCYEEFVDNPVDNLTALMHWVDEEIEPQQLEATMMNRDPRAGTKEFGLLGKEVSAARVGQWRGKLSANEINRIERALGEAMAYVPKVRE